MAAGARRTRWWPVRVAMCGISLGCIQVRRSCRTNEGSKNIVLRQSVLVRSVETDRFDGGT